MAKTTRKPATAAKPSEPVHRVRRPNRPHRRRKTSRKIDAENLRSVRRRRIRQAEGSQVRGRGQRAAGQSRQGFAPEARRSHDARHGAIAAKLQPAGCMPAAADWCRISRTTCTSTSSLKTRSTYLDARPEPPAPTYRVPGTRSRRGIWSSPRKAGNAAGRKQRSLNETATSSPSAPSTSPIGRHLSSIALPSP